MSSTRPRPLPDGLRRRAERLLDTDLSDVRVHVGPAPAALGALAFTRGRAIHVVPEVLARPLRAQAWLLGHELAHVAQQAAGRVEPTDRVAGVPCSHDTAHEADADAFAACLLADGRWSPARAGRARSARAVVQRAVRLGDAQLEAGDDVPLDEREQHVLDLVEGGREWLAWALGGPQTFSFADHEGLLEGVQVGLHGRPFMLLPRTRLEVSPLKLLELSTAELAALVRYERRTGAPPSRARIGEILARHRLRSQDALELGRRHIDSVGLGAAPLFHNLSLEDAIELFELVDALSGAIETAHANQREAAVFAAGLAGSPREFVDYHRFYMAYLEKVVRLREGDVPQGPAARRSDEARALVQALTPCVWDLLKCPWFDSPPLPEALPATLRHFTAGKPLGFGRVSSAVYQTFAQAEPDGTEPDPAALVESYRREITFFLHEAEAASASLSQDGLSRSFVVESPAARSRLELGPGGLLALERFDRKVQVH